MKSFILLFAALGFCVQIGYSNDRFPSSTSNHVHTGKDVSLLEQLGYAIANVEIRSISGVSVIALPIDSVFHNGTTAYVIAEDSGEAGRYERHVIKLGDTDGKYIEAMEGILPGERILIQRQKLSLIGPEEVAALHASRSAQVVQAPPHRYGYSSDVRSSGKSFGIQVGAFSSRSNAIQIANQLRAQFHRADVLPVSSNGRSLYRVRVGEFGSIRSARSTSSQLEKAGFPQAFVVSF